MKTFIVIAVFIISLAAGAVAQNGPSLQETTTWIHDFVETHGTVPTWEDAHETDVTKFDISFMGDGCITAIDSHTTLSIDGTVSKFWERYTFSLRNIDPRTVTAFDAESYSGIRFATTNNRKNILNLYPRHGGAGDTVSANEEYSTGFSVDSNNGGHRLAKAFRHAVELCGGKPSAF
jgi:hypothetical protein